MSHASLQSRAAVSPECCLPGRKRRSGRRLQKAESEQTLLSDTLSRLQARHEQLQSLKILFTYCIWLDTDREVAAIRPTGASADTKSVPLEDCARVFFACGSFEDFKATVQNLLDQEWLWRLALEQDERILQKIKDDDFSVHPEYAARDVSYRLTELRIKLFCDLIGLEAHIPRDYAYGTGVTGNEDSAGENTDAASNLEEAIARLSAHFEKLAVASLPEQPPDDKVDGVVVPLRLSPKLWKNKRHSRKDEESATVVRSLFDDDSPAIAEFVKQLAFAFEISIGATPRTETDVNKVVVILAIGVSGWWRAGGYNSALTKQMMTLAAAKAVARRYALHLARLNRIGRSPELVMHGFR
ncbi:MAG: hypothetical protein MHM6MM_005533 [Cercozoa sp. M6MM]